jgi:hypothetical protein
MEHVWARTEVHAELWWTEDHLEDTGVDGRIILKWIFEKWDRGLDSIDLAQDRNMWRAVVNAVMKHRVL